MAETIYEIGAVTAGEGTLSIRPKYRPPVAKRGVQFVHGAGSDATYCIQDAGDQAPLTRKIAEAGYTGISGDIGGPATWGNSAATAGIGAHRLELLSRQDVKSGKIALVSASMGGLAAFNWAGVSPTLVSCLVTVIPVINLNDIYVNNRDGYGAAIGAAYGGSYSESTLGSTRNPLTMATQGKFKNLPMLIFYGQTDTLCRPEFVTQFVSAVGGNLITLVPLPSGHDFTSYSLVDHDQIVSFLNQHA